MFMAWNDGVEKGRTLAYMASVVLMACKDTADAEYFFVAD